MHLMDAIIERQKEHARELLLPLLDEEGHTPGDALSFSTRLPSLAVPFFWSARHKAWSGVARKPSDDEYTSLPAIDEDETSDRYLLRPSHALLEIAMMGLASGVFASVLHETSETRLFVTWEDTWMARVSHAMALFPEVARLSGAEDYAAVTSCICFVFTVMFETVSQRDSVRSRIVYDAIHGQLKCGQSVDLHAALWVASENERRVQDKFKAYAELIERKGNGAGRAGRHRGCSACGEPRKGLPHCGGCLKVWYCDPDCQRRDWRRHREECLKSRVSECCRMWGEEPV
jgi:hypothetical protein